MLRPYSLINTHGKPYYGHFAHPVNDVNVQDADYRTPMNRRAGKWKRHFHFKRFQYFGGIANDLIFGCALADLRYLGAVFVYLYRPSDNKMLTWQYKTPLAYGLDMTNRPDNGVSTFELGKRRILMRYELNSVDERKKILEIDLGRELSLKAVMRESADYQSMALCTPTAVNGWVYAQKTAALTVSGNIDSALGRIDLDKQACYGHHDFSAGYMRRETFWNWACFSGADNQGQAVGLNVSWGVNETGYSENCFWVGNRLHLLPQVQFRFDRDSIQDSWRITSEDKRIDLAFVPEGMHSEHVNALVLATNFKQLFGRFHGYLIDDDGTRHNIENLYGFVEDQYSKW